MTNPAWWRESAQAQALACGRHQRVPRRSRLRQAEGQDRTTTCPDGPTGVPAERRVRPHPRLALLRRPGRRLRDRRLRQLERPASARCAASCCRTRSTCRAEPAPAGGWGLTLLLHSLSANYNQFAGSHNQSQFAAPRRRLDRDHALRPRPGRLVLRPRRRGHLRSLGRRRRALPPRTPPSPTSPATRWAATARTSSPASSRTCSPRAQPTVGPPGLGVWVPPAEPQPGGEPVADRADARLGAQRAVPDLGRDDRRARADRGRARTGRRRSTRSATATNSTSSRRAST